MAMWEHAVAREGVAHPTRTERGYALRAGLNEGNSMSKQRTHSPARRRCAPTAIACAAAATALGIAADFSFAGNTWDGGAGAGDVNWSNNTNWDPDGPPGYGTITFAGSTSTTNTMDQSYNMNQLAFTGSSSWTLNN